MHDVNTRCHGPVTLFSTVLIFLAATHVHLYLKWNTALTVRVHNVLSGVLIGYTTETT